MARSTLFEHGLPALETPRIRLRHPRELDGPDFLRIFGDSEALRYWSHGPLEDESAALAYIESIHEGARSKSFFQWSLCSREDDRMMGTVTLAGWNPSHRRADLGFILERSRWGQGLAREAVSRVLRFAFEEMGLHRVEADVDPENAASLGLLDRLGFRREGYLRERWYTYGSWKDTVLLGLLARHWSE